MTIELEKKLQKRFDDAQAKKDKQLADIKRLQADLQKLLKKIPRRPKDTAEGLDSKIAKLEHERTINSMPIAQEKNILREISTIQKAKSQIDEYESMEKTVQDTKNLLNENRDGLRISIASLDEMNSALQKVRLANNLECKVDELTSETFQCPEGKLGVVIGKNGSMVKQIQEQCKVSIDVDKESGAIKMTGNAASNAKAMAQLESLTNKIEKEIDLSKELVVYLTAKYVDAVTIFREKYHDMKIDVSKSNAKLYLKGAPRRVQEAEDEITTLDIVSKHRALEGREFSILLGKKGSTIDKIVSTHKLSIEVEKGDDESSSAIVTGPAQLVDTVLQEISELMDENKEIIESIELSVLVRRLVLSEGGKRIKAMQSKANETLKETTGGSCYLQVGKEERDGTSLLVKAKPASLATAVETAKEGLKEINTLITELTVDPYIVPRLLGKGGETIKKLTEGTSKFLEVDRKSGKVLVAGLDAESRDALLTEVQQIIEDNQVLRLDGKKEVMRAQLREYGRSKAKTEISELAWVDFDQSNDCFILRGKKDTLEKAKGLFLEFLANTHIEEVPASDDDLETLLSGGKGSQIMKLAEETETNLSAERSSNSIFVRGSPSNVEEAKRKLSQFLHGGDGFSVAKFSVTEQVVGVVIGKGGKKRQELEKKHGGVSINISKSFHVSIRGPEEHVSACRIEILKLISSAKVSQGIEVTEEQHTKLQKNDTIKRIIQQIPVYTNYSDEKLTVRGSLYDVMDAISLLNEQLKGVYTTSIELDAPQFAKVRNTAKDPSHFERMGLATETKIVVDNKLSNITISGKRSNVRKAKDQVFDFLGFLLPGEMDRLKVPKPLQSTVGSAASLAEVSASVDGGVTAYLDRDLSAIVVRSTNSESVKQARGVVSAKIKEAEKLVYILQLDQAESWLLAHFIGKNGARISALQKECNCKFDISKESRTITCVAESEEVIKLTKEKVDSVIEKGRKENLFVKIPERAMSSFVGKGGSNIKEMSSTLGVELQSSRKGPSQIKVSGTEEKVAAAQKSIEEWLAAWQEANGSIELPLEKQFFAVVIGPKGETAKAIQAEFGCRLDIQREKEIVSIRGGDKEKRDQVVQKIIELVETERVAKSEAAAAKAALRQKAKEANTENRNSQANVKKSASDDSLSQQVKKSEFPALPVGMTAKKSNNSTKRMEASGHQATEQGRSLFELLVSE